MFVKILSKTNVKVYGRKVSLTIFHRESFVDGCRDTCPASLLSGDVAERIESRVGKGSRGGAREREYLGHFISQKPQEIVLCPATFPHPPLRFRRCAESSARFNLACGTRARSANLWRQIQILVRSCLRPPARCQRRAGTEIKQRITRSHRIPCARQHVRV